MMSCLVFIVLVFAVAFLLGSVPWGLVISKIVYKKDIRDEGSGNIGTTNAMRSLGKIGGASVFLLDFGKGLLSGFIALSVAAWIVESNWDGALDVCLLFIGDKIDAHSAMIDGYFTQLCVTVSFLGCVWGHIFSPWLGFKGGKGIAVAVGCLFMVFGPVGALLELSIFIVLVLLSRYVSLGSVAAAAACPFFSLYYFWGNWPAIALCTVAAITVVWAHRENIKRLMSGTERRIGDKKEKEAEAA